MVKNKQKIFGFKMIVFIYMTVMLSLYIWACYMHADLLQLQGVVLLWLGTGAGMIGVREITKMKSLEKKK